MLNVLSAICFAGVLPLPRSSRPYPAAELTALPRAAADVELAALRREVARLREENERLHDQNRRRVSTACDTALVPPPPAPPQLPWPPRAPPPTIFGDACVKGAGAYLLMGSFAAATSFEVSFELTLLEGGSSGWHPVLYGGDDPGGVGMRGPGTIYACAPPPSTHTHTQ